MTKKLNEEQILGIWPVLLKLVFIGLIALILFSFRYTWETHTSLVNFLDILNSFGGGLLISGASALLGGIIGFLFGIPKVVQNTSLLPDEEKANHTLILHNDNLVQISDWLTKIIIGVGLTQLYSIPGFLGRVGNFFKIIFGNDQIGKCIVITVGVYFVILGFFAAYVWTRLYFVRLLKSTDEALQEKLKETEQKLESSQEVIKTTSEENKRKSEDLDALIKTYAQSFYDNIENLATDPQKGKWGGKNENNGRKLSAVVRESDTHKEWFNISLEVTSTNPARPLTGKVIFHLHPTIPAHDVEVDSENNKAQLSVFAWGAFTVGVECDNSATKLELDLAEIPDVSPLFKSR